jgi:hypothetical protein
VAPVPDARLLHLGALRLLAGRVHHGGGRLDAGALDAMAPVAHRCPAPAAFYTETWIQGHVLDMAAFEYLERQLGSTCP